MAQKSELDHLDLSQHATVIWDGPTHDFTTLSKATVYVMEYIPKDYVMRPLITIGEHPFLLEFEQIQYLYGRYTSTEIARSA